MNGQGTRFLMQPPKITDNGWFKFTERMLVLIGIPTSLALGGWILNSIVTTGESVVEIKTVQERKIIPDIEKILNDHDTFSTKDDLHSLELDLGNDIDKLEDRVEFFLYKDKLEVP